MSPNLNLALGDLGIVVALAAAVMGCLSLIGGLRFSDHRMSKLGFQLSGAVFAGAALSFVVMERALITRDFEIFYVS